MAHLRAYFSHLWENDPLWVIIYENPIYTRKMKKIYWNWFENTYLFAEEGEAASKSAEDDFSRQAKGRKDREESKENKAGAWAAKSLERSWESGSYNRSKVEIGGCSLKEFQS